ncbi:TPA: TolC family protein, partial [Escherichia coli]
MKYISHAFVLFTGLFSSAQSFATNCIIDAVFQKNEKWNSYSIDIKELENSRQANIKRMLPSINIGVGQYIQNNQWLTDISESNLHLSLSYDFLSGFETIKENDRLDVVKRLKYIELLYARNDYIINLFSKIVDYKAKKSQIKLMREQYKKLEKEYESTKEQAFLGIVSTLDVDIRSNVLNRMKLDIETLEEELNISFKKIFAEYHIPKEMLLNITYDKLKACKIYDFQSLLKENNKWRLLANTIDYDIKKISDYPSFYLSLGMMPKKGGALKDFSFKEMDYNASLGITFPLMRIFDTSENQKTQAMHISQIHNEYIRESIKLDILHKEIFTKLTLLKKRIPILEDELNLKKREVEYIHERIKSKQDTIL